MLQLFPIVEKGLLFRLQVRKSWIMIRFSRLILIGIVLPFLASPGLAQSRFEMEPINYSRAKPTDKVYQFAQKLANGTEWLNGRKSTVTWGRCWINFRFRSNHKRWFFLKNESLGQSNYTFKATCRLFQRWCLSWVGAEWQCHWDFCCWTQIGGNVLYPFASEEENTGLLARDLSLFTGSWFLPYTWTSWSHRKKCLSDWDWATTIQFGDSFDWWADRIW